MTNKKRGVILIALGTLLLSAAVSLVLYNRHRDRKAGDNAQNTTALIREHIAERIENGDPVSGNDAFGSAEMPQASDEDEPDDSNGPEPLEIDGVYYIGLISLPKLGIELPVTKDWSYNGMADAACRYTGSLYRRNLIICAHNYSSFFLDLEKLGEGDEVIFTSLDGREHHYVVGWQELIGGYDTNTMLSGSEDWDLTLFTCTWSGYSRVTLRCVLD